MAKKLQLLRNSAVFENKAAALAGLRTQLMALAAGEPCIASYTDGDAVSILLGVSYGDGKNFQVFEGAKITSGGTIELPQEVEDAINDAVSNIKGDIDEEINDAYDTIKEIADALGVINGDESTEGSIAKAEKDAKDYADEKIAALDFTDAAVAGQYVDSVSETDGVISVTRKPITSADKSVVLNTTNGVDLSVNIDGTTILRNPDNGKLSVASAALVQYVGADAIKVSEVQDGNKTISLAINAADKVLTQTTDGLLTNINLTWSNTDGLKLIGKEGAEIATIPATDFIKDGMLENVELKVASVGKPVGEETEGTFLVFTFNTDAGKEVINLDVTSLIDIYTAGDGINIAGKVVSIKRDASSEAFLTVGADGLKLSGVQAAIDAASGASQTAIDKVEASVGLAADGSHTKTSGNYTSGATTVVGEIAALDAALKTANDTIAANKATIDAYTVNGFAINTNPVLDGADVALSDAYATSELVNDALKLASGDTLDTAFGKIEKAILDNEEVCSQTHEAFRDVIGLTGDTVEYEAQVSGNYISGATSLNDADVKLDAAIKAVSDTVAEMTGNTENSALLKVVAGNGIAVTEKSNRTQTISAVVVASDPIIEVTEAGIKTKENSVYDCGMY